MPTRTFIPDHSTRADASSSGAGLVEISMASAGRQWSAVDIGNLDRFATPGGRSAAPTLMPDPDHYLPPGFFSFP
jgi:hypothetical protein